MSRLHGMLLGLILPVVVPSAETSAQTLEMAVGPGYVFGGGAENPGPSLATITGSLVVWPTRHWGVAVRRVVGPGEDLYDDPAPSGDRTFLGLGHLRYWTVTTRHRRPLASRAGLELGAGLTLLGQYADIVEFHSTPPRRDDGSGSAFGGFALEALLSKAIHEHVALKAGATWDFNFETSNVQPLVLVSVGF